MATNKPTKGKKAGRPPTLTMPDPIPDTLENVAKAVLNTKPKKRGEWKFIQEQKGVADGTSSQTSG